MISDEQRVLAKQFKKMHMDDGILILPNAWDAGSAYIFEKQGFQAVATSSAGVAYALGYADGENIAFEDILFCVEQIIRRITIPLSVDFERGYATTIEKIKENARRFLQKGVVGFNIEDGKHDGTLDDMEFMAKKIAALAELKKELDIEFVINARTCTYLLNVADDGTKLKMAIERGNVFKEAGADCMFIPCVMNENVAAQLVKNINLPINLLINAEMNDIERLRKIGVSRLSLGCFPIRSALNHLISISDDLQNGKSTKLFNHNFSSGEANRYFKL